MFNKMIHTPEGVRDIYGRELERKLIIKERLRRIHYSYGYNNIETPSFEFSDIYSNEVGTTPEKEMYRFFDKEGNMLVLRPDFTPSVARCAAKYYVDDSMPIRLCYEGNAFNNTSELQGKLKESTQMGVELIESSLNPDSDAEVICLVAESLLHTGLTDFQICIGNSGYFRGICLDAGISAEDMGELREYMSAKNYFGAREFMLSLGMNDEHISAILDVTKIVSFDDILKAKEYVHNEMSIGAIDYLVNVYKSVKLRGFEHYVSVDLGLLSKFNYYTGTLFKGYTYGTGDAIVKGGRYDGLLGKFGKPSYAVGAVFLVDDIMTALSSQNILPEVKPSVIWVVYDADDLSKKKAAFKRIDDLRKDGRSAAAIAFDKTKTKEDYSQYCEKHDIVNSEFFI